MKKILSVLTISVFLLIGAQAWSQDVGSVDCNIAQQAAITAVTSGGPYKNLGKLVSTAAKATDPYVYSGQITEECQSCIMNQFARQIPIGEQEACGPACHDLCTTGDALNGTCDSCVSSICAVDPYCCEAYWDGICVGEVTSVCGICCNACDHSGCVTGSALAPCCGSCAASVCSYDDYCCSVEWDSICVSEAETDPNCLCDGS